MEVYSVKVVCLLVLFSCGQGIDATSGDTYNQYKNLHLEVAKFQEEILHETMEIEEWTARLERLKESIFTLKKEKEFIQTQGKFYYVNICLSNMPQFFDSFLMKNCDLFLIFAQRYMYLNEALPLKPQFY